MSTYTYPRAGLSNVGSFQVSGIPFVTGSLVVPISTGTPLRIDFPTVTKKIILSNEANVDIRVGFSEDGVKGSNYVMLHTKNEFPLLELEVKVASIFLLSAGAETTASLAAELTTIPVSEIANNWSGSAGVG